MSTWTNHGKGNLQRCHLHAVIVSTTEGENNAPKRFYWDKHSFVSLRSKQRLVSVERRVRVESECVTVLNHTFTFWSSRFRFPHPLMSRRLQSGIALEIDSWWTLLCPFQKKMVKPSKDTAWPTRRPVVWRHPWNKADIPRDNADGLHIHAGFVGNDCSCPICDNHTSTCPGMTVRNGSSPIIERFSGWLNPLQIHFRILWDPVICMFR